jgi:hypothetical protein
MKFLQTLSESRFLSSKGAFKKYSAKQIAELAYLHIIALRILQCESLTHDFAKDYAFRTNRYSGFARWYQNATDLHLLLFALHDEDVELKMPEASKEFKENLYFDEGELQSWLKDVARNTNNSGKVRRLFMHMDGTLQIKDASMKAIRRLVQDWPMASTRQKQLAMTRLLQMLRLRARQSDLLVRLEAVANSQRLELKNVNNPETGDERKDDGAEPEHLSKPQPKHSTGNMLKGLAAFAGGAMLGYHTVKALGESQQTHDIIREPSLDKLIEMKLLADHNDGLGGVIDSKGNLHVFDGSFLTHARAKQSLGLTESTSVRLWAGYVEVLESNSDLQLLFNHPTLVEFYDGDAEVIMEDASAGATAAGGIAACNTVLGSVQRRAMPNPSIYQPKSKKKKKKS